MSRWHPSHTPDMIRHLDKMREDHLSRPETFCFARNPDGTGDRKYTTEQEVRQTHGLDGYNGKNFCAQYCPTCQHWHVILRETPVPPKCVA